MIFSFCQMNAAAAYPTLSNGTLSSNFEFHLKVYDIFASVFGVLIVLINFTIVISSGLVIHYNGGDEDQRSTFIFLGSLGTSDFLNGISILFGQWYPRNKRNDFVCRLALGLVASSSINSSYNIALLAFDRYLYILHGLKYRLLINPLRARLLVACSFILAFAVGFFCIQGLKGNTDNGMMCFFLNVHPINLQLLPVVLGSIPLIITIVLYSGILRQALKKIKEKTSDAKNYTSNEHLRRFRGGTSRTSISQDEIQTDKQRGAETNVFSLRNLFAPLRRKKLTCPVSNSNRWKAIKVVVFITASYLFTYGPFIVALLIYYFCCDHHTSSGMCENISYATISPLPILAMMNSISNPVVYVWWHSGFRKRICKIFKIMQRERCEARLDERPNSRVTGNALTLREL